MQLFPAWLPEAEYVEGPGGGGVAAVRALAVRLAARKPDTFAPFLADLAERSLSGGAKRAQCGDEVRAAGLTRVIAASYGRERLALVIQVPAGLSPAAEEELSTACDWLTYRGRMAVWLTGAALRYVNRIPTVQVHIDAPGGTVVDALGSAGSGDVQLPPVSYPPVAGRPHAGSPAERRLETALAKHSWAAGRAWNQTFSLGPLENKVRLDLVWQAESCVVEVDGDEHRQKEHYGVDRWRDVSLQLHGYAVLRFTNEQINQDLDSVVRRIEQFIRSRREGQRGV